MDYVNPTYFDLLPTEIIWYHVVNNLHISEIVNLNEIINQEDSLNNYLIRIIRNKLIKIFGNRGYKIIRKFLQETGAILTGSFIWRTLLNEDVWPAGEFDFRVDIDFFVKNSNSIIDTLTLFYEDLKLKPQWKGEPNFHYGRLIEYDPLCGHAGKNFNIFRVIDACDDDDIYFKDTRYDKIQMVIVNTDLNLQEYINSYYDFNVVKNGYHVSDTGKELL